MNDKEGILKLKDGEKYHVKEGDYGKCEVWRFDDYYDLYEVPYLGGEPTFMESYKLDEIDKMIAEYESWT